MAAPVNAKKQHFTSRIGPFTVSGLSIRFGVYRPFRLHETCHGRTTGVKIYRAQYL